MSTDPNGADPNAPVDFWQPLDYVLEGRYEGLYERTKLLVESGAEINLEDRSGDQSIHSLFKDVITETEQHLRKQTQKC